MDIITFHAFEIYNTHAKLIYNKSGVLNQHYLIKKNINSVAIFRDYCTWLVFIGCALVFIGYNQIDYGVLFIGLIILSYQFYRFTQSKMVISCGCYVYQGSIKKPEYTRFLNWLCGLSQLVNQQNNQLANQQTNLQNNQLNNQLNNLQTNEQVEYNDDTNLEPVSLNGYKKFKNVDIN